MLAPILRLSAGDDRILVGPETADDAGVLRFQGTALVATVDFITPVCDEPYRYGRVAAANSLSDVFAMGGHPLFALNICCFPEKGVPDMVFSEILRGAAETVYQAGGVILGGHSVGDDELKFGLSVVGQVEPDQLWANASAQVGDRLILTKPLGTGVLINAYKIRKLDASGLEPALLQMERLNAEATRLGQQHGVHAATDITGFALAGHALEMSKASGVGIRIRFADLPVHEGFYAMVRKGVSTNSTRDNEANVETHFEDLAKLNRQQREILFDPQTSGGLLLSTPAGQADALLVALRSSGHEAADIGQVIDGPPRLEIV
jgi:selenide,water dikinase